MSRSSPTLTNPSAHFYEWAGKTGTLSYYDKEKKESVTVPLPFSFLVADELSKIVGYNKQEQSGYWSNEVRSTKRDELVVKTKHGVAEQGLYENLTKVRSKGGKYAKSVYIVTKSGDGYEINNFTAAGSALSAWIDFTQIHKVQNGKVVMTKGIEQESPVGTFYPPAFAYVSASPDEDAAAIALDKTLQDFLRHYLTTPQEDDSVERVDDLGADTFNDTDGKASAEQLAKFDQLKASKQVDPNDYPPDDEEDRQQRYNRQAAEVSDVFSDGSPIPEYRG